MSVEHESRGDRQHSLTMTGLVHEVTVMTSGSDYDPLLVQIDRGTDTMTCLLDQEDINALARFFAEYAKPDD